MEQTPTLRPIEVSPDLDAVQRMRIELGTTLPELAAERLEDIRLELRETMKIVDDTSTRDIHVAVGEITNLVDTLRRSLAERAQS